MATKIKAAPNARWHELTGEFPLRPLRSDADAARAVAMADRLTDLASLTPEEEDYLAVLSGLIVEWEDEHEPDDLSPADMLRYLIESAASPRPRWRGGPACPMRRSRISSSAAVRPAGRRSRRSRSTSRSTRQFSSEPGDESIPPSARLDPGRAPPYHGRPRDRGA